LKAQQQQDQETIQKLMKTQLESISNELTNISKNALNTMQQDMEKVTRKTSKMILTRNVLLPLLVGIMLSIGIATGTAIFTTLQNNKVVTLSQEIANLETNKQNLEAQGAKFHLSKCKDGKKSRLCIQVEPNKTFGDKEETFMIIKGY
ncbi:hypothetical protein, partial [Arsenophonus nasoniae]|uniref:hypothetical protein n=1 Tax=Arsenophonus nasoniae TaxID=638 RepID=UPI00387A160D